VSKRASPLFRSKRPVPSFTAQQNQTTENVLSCGHETCSAAPASSKKKKEKEKKRKKYSFQLFRLTRPFFFLGSVFL
jgi:hypothetical protein